MELSENIKKLVIARLQTLPKNIRTSIGNFGSFKKDELIKAVEEENEIGKLIVEEESREPLLG